MSNATTYRMRAAECDAYARKEISPHLREQWHAMASSYRLLAEQAGKNAMSDLVYETPPMSRAPLFRPPELHRPQQQVQQQQAQPGPKNEP